MSTEDNNNSTGLSNTCANCGKVGGDVTNICNKCKQVKYCNAACKKKHRHKHKQECEEHVRQAAERAAELHDIELFKEPPQLHEDCPICFLRIPMINTGRRYMTCCGKTICGGCFLAPRYDDQGNIITHVCAFCRVPTPSDEEAIERDKKRVEVGDPIAIYNQGCYYYDGRNGFPKDNRKALELRYRAAELGYTEAYVSIGYAFDIGRGVKVDKKKANHYLELAAMMGNEIARYNLGANEEELGNIERALKHYMIAVEGGNDDSLMVIKSMCQIGDATKDDYMKALQLYQAYLGEIKSIQRDKAAAVDEDYRYY